MCLFRNMAVDWVFIYLMFESSRLLTENAEKPQLHKSTCCSVRKSFGSGKNKLNFQGLLSESEQLILILLWIMSYSSELISCFRTLCT